MRTWSPQGSSKEILLACQQYFDEYSEFITLKQLFYLFVAEGRLENTEAAWRRLKALTIRARKHKRLAPTAFSLDQHLAPARYTVDASQYLKQAQRQYRIPRTYGQPNHLEIWVEREPLNVFVQNLVSAYDVPVLATGGYSNYGFLYAAAERLRDSASRTGAPRILYLADFSPDSHTMFESVSEDLASELNLTRQEMSTILFRGAILPEHIAKYTLPPSFIKARENKNPSFRRTYGDLAQLVNLDPSEYVEIEALNPSVLAEIIENVMFSLLDTDVLEQVAHQEAAERQRIARILGTTGG